MYYVSTDPIEIISGTSNRLNPVYVEAAKEIDGGTPKSMIYLKNFLKSVSAIESKAGNDGKISSSRGNITKFSGYDNIKTHIKFLDKYISDLKFYKDLKDIYNCLENYVTPYSEAYERNVSIVIQEYESALHLLIMGLGWAMANYVEINHKSNGIIEVKKRSGTDPSPVLTKLASDMSTRLKSEEHRSYLQTMVNSRKASLKKESVYYEGNIADTWQILTNLASTVSKGFDFGKRAVQAIRKSIFGILPLIRICLYFRYKKKADAVLNLEQQAQFIRMNIEQLQNIKGMDEAKKKTIIKKQQAKIEEYNKKAAKLRAQLSETEKEVATEVKKKDSDMGKDSDDDFVIEGFNFTEAEEDFDWSESEEGDN